MEAVPWVAPVNQALDKHAWHCASAVVDYSERQGSQKPAAASRKLRCVDSKYCRRDGDGGDCRLVMAAKMLRRYECRAIGMSGRVADQLAGWLHLDADIWV